MSRNLFLCHPCMKTQSSLYTVCRCEWCTEPMSEVVLTNQVPVLPRQTVEYMSEHNNVVKAIRQVREARQTGTFTQGLWGSAMIQWQGKATLFGVEYLVTAWSFDLVSPPKSWTVGEW